MKNLLVASDRGELYDRLDTLNDASVRRWGRMSVNGMLCHLTDAFRMALGEKPARRRGGVAGRTVVRFVALHLPIRWPKGVRGPAEIDQELGGTRPENFASDREGLRSAVEAFVERIDPETMTHPLFGRLSAREWGVWGYRHLDHHLRQFGA